MTYDARARGISLHPGAWHTTACCLYLEIWASGFPVVFGSGRGLHLKILAVLAGSFGNAQLQNVKGETALQVTGLETVTILGQCTPVSVVRGSMRQSYVN